MKRIHFLDCAMDVATMDETVSFIADRVEQGTYTQHSVVNVAKLVNIQSDAYLKRSVTECDVINIDGMGVVFGARMLGYDIPERVSGIDLFEQLLKLCSDRGYRIFLLGATPSVLVQTTFRILKMYPDILIGGSHHGYFWDDEKSVVDQIRASGARFLFVAMSSPQKENFISKWSRKMGIDFVMGVGGTFDVFSGKVRRAPRWMQILGLEWLFRVFQEPRRMWKRYLKTNAIFFGLLIREKFRMLVNK
ncbi:MAG: WecB/TagA/CpsF family glycosyltransferase [bacterium]|nr:glycosyltransferase [Gammaproteobacteria bacterium]HIL96493.1 glycosyltransferase [Pseudomonadales bacterium]